MSIVSLEPVSLRNCQSQGDSTRWRQRPEHQDYRPRRLPWLDWKHCGQHPNVWLASLESSPSCCGIEDRVQLEGLRYEYRIEPGGLPVLLIPFAMAEASQVKWEFFRNLVDMNQRGKSSRRTGEMR